ncbi:MAG: VWA domain-containing protein [Chloroflexota bacterium]|nr:VWA domain-containing protein [Chloroflexota bacterium]
MTFIWPTMLILLLAVPALVVLYVRGQQRRRRLLVYYGHAGVGASQGSERGLGARRHVPSAIFLVALTILIVALARPQATVGLPRLEGTVILAFDVSASMGADDIKPTRLEAAKAAARDFVAHQPSSVQIGMVSFSEGGFSTQAPTSDQAAILTAISRLSLQSGTSVAHGIDASLKAIQLITNPPLSLSTRGTPGPGGQVPTPSPVPKGTYGSAVIILLTDGENNENPDPMELAQTAAQQGIRIYTVGLGSASGATLHLKGFTVVSRLDEQTLKQIADLTGGTYYNADNETDLQTIYNNLNPQLIIKPQQMEITSLFAGAGLLVMLAGGTLSLLWLGRLP